MKKREAAPKATVKSTAKAPAATQLDGSSLFALQQTAGNSAVAGMLSGERTRPAVQREDPPGPTAAPGARTPPLGSETALRRAETIRGAASARLLKVAAYNQSAGQAIAAYRDKRIDYADKWARAWGRHSAILSQAGEEASTENMIEGIVVGVVLGVAVAAAAAALFPAAAAASIGTATWFAFNVGSGVVAGGAGAGAMQGFQADAPSNTIGRPSVPGPTSGARDAAADAWEAIARVEDDARRVSNLAPRFGLELGNAEYSIAQVNAHISGGQADMNWDQTLNMVSTLANWENSLAAFDAQIDQATSGMDSFMAAIQAWEIPSTDSIETEIWYAWMSTLNDHTDEALDQDVIQKYLTKRGLLPDTWYLSDNDQHRAVAAAKAHVAATAPGGGAPQ